MLPRRALPTAHFERNKPPVISLTAHLDQQLSFDAFAAGRAASPGYDEAFGVDGAAREHWRALLNCLDSMGGEEIADRAETCRRIIREQGVTLHVPGANQGEESPWELDILPLVIGAGDWQVLERGLIQRARLMNAILGDLYGSQHSLRNGWLPAPLVYANPSFVRACQGVRIPDDNRLPFYAVDLARSPDGQWWVLADRTQAPSGIGFALENRTLLSRVLPEALQAIQPRLVDGLLQVMRETLVNLAPGRRENPTVVVLTPGPHNEAYFEHTYLARMLGFTLAEGGDLTVRNRRLYIKTLEGLRTVDVILRRVSDAFCDPLEFRQDSLLGVPGLFEAVRAGNVAIANPFGCGLIESPGLMAFLPNLCRHLLGEELLLPSVATWWCGEEYEMDYVTRNLESLVIRPAFSLPCDAARLDSDEAAHAALWQQFQSRPHEFVGQEEVRLSHVPVFQNGRFGSGPFTLRAFVTNTGGVCHVAPGGLVRLALHGTQSSRAFPLTGISKDFWLLPVSGADAEPHHPMAEPALFTERAPIDLPSRAADNLFWLGRYTERLENLLRITRYSLGSLSVNLGASGMRRLTALAGTLMRMEVIPTKEPFVNDLRERLGMELLDIISGDDVPGGVTDLLKRIQNASFAVRDRLSADTWRLLSRLERDLASESGNLSMLTAHSVLDILVLDLAAFSGMEMENMTRGHGWIFLDLGRRLERSLNLIELLEAAFAAGDRIDLLLEPVLDICDSVITYRRRHFAEIRLPGVLNLLLLEPHNPRSLAFQLDAISRSVGALPEEPNPEGLRRVRQHVETASAELHALKIEELEQAVLTPAPTRLFEISRQLVQVSQLLTQVYFSHIVPRVI